MGYRFIQRQRLAAAPGKPSSYSAQAAALVLGVDFLKLQRLFREGLLTADVPKRGCSEEELKRLHREVRNLRAEGLIK
jgi:hypothetical protein